jgi:hypothetical protein
MKNRFKLFYGFTPTIKRMVLPERSVSSRSEVGKPISVNAFLSKDAYCGILCLLFTWISNPIGVSRVKIIWTTLLVFHPAISKIALISEANFSDSALLITHQISNIGPFGPCRRISINLLFCCSVKCLGMRLISNFNLANFSLSAFSFAWAAWTFSKAICLSDSFLTLFICSSASVLILAICKVCSWASAIINSFLALSKAPAFLLAKYEETK